MTPAQAAAFMAMWKWWKVTHQSIEDPSFYLFVTPAMHGAELDGAFSCEQLEAIAVWMRYPADVAHEYHLLTTRGMQT